MKDYVSIQNSLKGLPITWYPALMLTIIEEAIKKKTWKKNKINIFVKKYEEKIHNETKRKVPLLRKRN